MSITRADLYKAFGPLLLEAIVKVTLNEINVVRANAGLSARTNQQLMDALETELATLDPHNWMG